jgi:hypothetical protein
MKHSGRCIAIRKDLRCAGRAGAAGRDGACPRGRRRGLQGARAVHRAYGGDPYLPIHAGLLLDSRDQRRRRGTFCALRCVDRGRFGSDRGPGAIQAMLEKYMGPATPGLRDTSTFDLLTNEAIEVDGDRVKGMSKLVS